MTDLHKQFCDTTGQVCHRTAVKHTFIIIVQSHAVRGVLAYHVFYVREKK